MIQTKTRHTTDLKFLNVFEAFEMDDQHRWCVLHVHRFARLLLKPNNNNDNNNHERVCGQHNSSQQRTHTPLTCNMLHPSQKNLSSPPSRSTALKFSKQCAIELTTNTGRWAQPQPHRSAYTHLFCTMSTLKSKKHSSRDVTYAHGYNLVVASSAHSTHRLAAQTSRLIGQHAFKQLLYERFVAMITICLVAFVY